MTGPADLQRFAVKIFAERRAPLEVSEFIPVFHRWIRDRAVPGILIDVADYGHLPEGPGVMLVGHEADYAMDAMEGPFGLLYTRKRPSPGALAGRLEAALRAAQAAGAKLEEEFAGRLVIGKGEALFLSNDRLLAPNDGAAFEALRPALESAASAVFGGADVRREEGDPRRRLAVRLTCR